jgi:hypothetical protein
MFAASEERPSQADQRRRSSSVRISPSTNFSSAIVRCSVVALIFLLEPRFSAPAVSLAACCSDELLHVELAHLVQRPLHFRPNELIDLALINENTRKIA